MVRQAGNIDTESATGSRVVEATREPIELYKILKFEGLVSSGAEAKLVIASGQVLVNGVIETQKRKKIISGDTIEFGEDKFLIRLSSSLSNNVIPETKPKSNPQQEKTADRKAIRITANKSKNK